MSKDIDFDRNQLSWKTRWALRRNRVLGSGRFQEWAAKTPFFGAIARRKAAAQFDLVAGFIYTQITFVFVETGLIAFLREKPRTAAQIAEFLKMDGDATERLLRAGEALQLAESPQTDLWTLGEVGAAMAANEGAMAMIRHHAILYKDMADPIALLSDGNRFDSELSSFWSYAKPQKAADSDAAPYSELMRQTQPMVWQQIIGRYPFGRHSQMLDIGGGSGAFVEQVAAHAPDLNLGIFDLPDVAPLAEKRFAGSAIEGRVTVHSGSFRTDKIPTGYDLITLIRILHDHDDDVAQALLNRVYESLPIGGRLLIVEPMAKTKGAEKMGDAYFGLYLWAMGSGRPRSLDENKKMAKKAGFSATKEISTSLPLVARALVAIK